MDEKCYLTSGVRVVWTYEAPLTRPKLDGRLTMDISMTPFNRALASNHINQCTYYFIARKST